MAGGREGPGSPGWLRRVLRAVLPRGERDHLLGEMEELYRWKLEREGSGRARLWYARQVVQFAVRLLADAAARMPARTARGAAGLWRDVRHGARRLRRRPSYVCTAVLTLGVGVGGLASVYTVANWVLLRPVPGVADRAELVTIRLEMGGPSSPSFPISAPDLAEVAGDLSSVRDLAGGLELDVNLLPSGGAGPRRVTASVVTPNYFSVLRSTPAHGRFFHAASAASADPEARAVVVSHRLWRSVWGGSRSLVGRAIRVNDSPYTVVGVAPKGFRGAELPGRTDLWFPAAALPALDRNRPTDVLARRGTALFSHLVGRLAPGGTAERVPAEFEAAIERIRRERSSHSFGTLYDVGVYEGIGLSPRVRDEVRRTLGLLAGAGALLLLLAVANLANLGLSRALARSDSDGVRRALGASRFQVARGVLAEQLVLAGAGAVVSVLIALAGTRWFERFSLSTLGASLEGIRLDGRVVGFTLLAALAAAVLAGLAPAVLAARRATLHGRRRGARATARLQTAMAGSQVALSVVLVVAAGLLIRTVSNLRAVDAGFDPAHAIRFAVDPAAQGYDDVGTERLLERLRVSLGGRPGVSAVGYSAPQPLRTSYLTYAFRPSDQPRSDRPSIAAQLNVSAGFLEAMGVRPIAGRTFRPEDVEPGSGRRAVVVSESLAREAFPDARPAEAVGRTLTGGWGAREQMLLVVGVVEDPRVTGVLSDSPPVLFKPFHEAGSGPATVWIRGAAPTRTLAAHVGEAVRAADPTLPVFDLRTAREQLDRLIVEQRVLGGLAFALAAVGLLLAAVGLNGLLWYAVAERRREIGIRAALGATRARIVATTSRRGLVATAVGTLAGLAGSVAVGRLVESRLFGIEGFDPAVYAAGAAVVVTAAAAASWAPAYRATKVAPREVLSEE
ncbi:MAG: ABC transporter permease [Gemmatimonadota bacterium]